MKVERKEFAVVEFVDGSKAFFENPEMAKAVDGWYEKAQKFNAAMKVLGVDSGKAVVSAAANPPKPAGRKFRPKTCPACKCEFVPRSAAQRVCDACKAAGRKAPKTATTWKGQKPGGTPAPTPPPPAEPEKPVKRDLNCIEAKCFFCEGGSCSTLGNMVDCEKQLVRFCKRYSRTQPKGRGAEGPSAALMEVRKLAEEAGLRK